MSWGWSQSAFSVLGPSLCRKKIELCTDGHVLRSSEGLRIQARPPALAEPEQSPWSPCCQADAKLCVRKEVGERVWMEFGSQEKRESVKSWKYFCFHKVKNWIHLLLALCSFVQENNPKGTLEVYEFYLKCSIVWMVSGKYCLLKNSWDFLVDSKTHIGHQVFRQTIF